MNDFWKGIGILALYKIQGAISSLIMVLIMVSSAINGNEINESSLSIIVLDSMIIVQVVLIMILSYIYRDKLKLWFKDLNTNKIIKYIMKILKYYSFIILNAIFISIIMVLFFKDFSGDTSQNQMILESLLDNGSVISFIIITVITGPIIEEYVFRYAIINKLLKNKKIWIQILVSSLVFIFAHIGFNSASSLKELIYLMLLYTSTAPIFAYAYIKDGYKTSLGLHMFYNFVAVTMLLLI